jgi:hypothetical protein
LSEVSLLNFLRLFVFISQTILFDVIVYSIELRSVQNCNMCVLLYSFYSVPLCALLFYSIPFYSILFRSILILFYSICSSPFYSIVYIYTYVHAVSFFGVDV